ncbi:hypothetical protein CEXT_809151 [Caerostris extrusa]|uniref:Uncharacterized protein n=1 Tax=Caerostris extrusa TaxID=172846 RepID=A0AAV4Y3J4_CAEEX|nr:hypothetical protein CEXT_809151 [Caerostris extrusa]
MLASVTTVLARSAVSRAFTVFSDPSTVVSRFRVVSVLPQLSRRLARNRSCHVAYILAGLSSRYTDGVAFTNSSTVESVFQIVNNSSILLVNHFRQDAEPNCSWLEVESDHDDLGSHLKTTRWARSFVLCVYGVFEKYETVTLCHTDVRAALLLTCLPGATHNNAAGGQHHHCARNLLRFGQSEAIPVVVSGVKPALAAICASVLKSMAKATWLVLTKMRFPSLLTLQPSANTPCEDIMAGFRGLCCDANLLHSYRSIP